MDTIAEIFRLLNGFTWPGVVGLLILAIFAIAIAMILSGD